MRHEFLIEGIKSVYNVLQKVFIGHFHQTVSWKTINCVFAQTETFVYTNGVLVNLSKLSLHCIIKLPTRENVTLQLANQSKP